MQEKLLHRTLLLILSLFGLNTLASFFHWYQIFWWFDMPMHFFGGVFIILLISFIAERYFYASQNAINTSVLYRTCLYVLFGLLIGILWEYFEVLFNNILGGKPFFVLDTMSDLAFDFGGMLLGSLYLYFRYPFFRTSIKVRYNMFVCQTGI